MSTFDINCVKFSDVFYPLTKLLEGAAGPDMMPPILYKKTGPVFSRLLRFYLI